MKFITTSEAAVRLGVSRRHVNWLIQQGRIKATPLGSALRGNGAQPALWMLDEKDVEAFAIIPRPPGNPAFRKQGKKRVKPNTTMPGTPDATEDFPNTQTPYQEMMAKRKKNPAA